MIDAVHSLKMILQPLADEARREFQARCSADPRYEFFEYSGREFEYNEVQRRVAERLGMAWDDATRQLMADACEVILYGEEIKS